MLERYDARFAALLGPGRGTPAGLSPRDSATFYGRYHTDALRLLAQAGESSAQQLCASGMHASAPAYVRRRALRATPSSGDTLVRGLATLALAEVDLTDCPPAYAAELDQAFTDAALAVLTFDCLDVTDARALYGPWRAHVSGAWPASWQQDE